ncbi:hypothetical protein [Phocaeicola plebeius]|jgi:hypothetical protein|uniref:hypothetical protein n=2 Tax=Phocaeicola plebeius TaxID=310297 RepID=UPI0015FE3C87|nr:hypothetical protein [Phocaeicola plebeius]
MQQKVKGKDFLITCGIPIAMSLNLSLKESENSNGYLSKVIFMTHNIVLKKESKFFEILGITKTWFGSASKIYPEQIQIDRQGKKTKVTKLNDGAVLHHPQIPQNETYYIVDGKYYTQVYARVLIRHIGLQFANE